MKIIGLCGYSRTGKDTAAANMPGWTRFAFADALKEDLHSFADLLHVQISRFTPEEKEKFRPLMVAWGATARTFSPGFWIRRLRTAIDLFPPENPKIVITDVRYRDEVDAIYRWGGKVVYIERPGYSPGNDEEKRSFKEIDVKLPVVVNDSTPEELGKRVLGVCEKWEKER